jgi:HD superfamily phosphohydrolase
LINSHSSFSHVFEGTLKKSRTKEKLIYNNPGTYIFHVKLYERLIKVATIVDCVLSKSKKRQCKPNVEVTRTKNAV